MHTLKPVQGHAPITAPTHAPTIALTPVRTPSRALPVARISAVTRVALVSLVLKVAPG